MGLRLSRVAGIVLATLGVVLVWFLTYGASVVGAGGYPVHRPGPVTIIPLSTTEAIVAVLFAIAVAVAALLIVRHQRIARVAHIRVLAATHERDQKRKAA
jgi:hypothetical protein